MAGGRTSAKPRWSEVMIFLDVLLRRQNLNRRKPPAPISGVLIGGQDCVRELSSGEGMLAGGELAEGGGTPAKPRWSELMIFLGVLLRQGTP